MNADSIVYVLEELGSPRVKNLGKNVQASCPLAPWNHGSGSDASMKLGVLVTQGMSPANCFYPGCFHGTLLELVDAVATKKITDGDWELGGDEVSNLKAFVMLAEETDEVDLSGGRGAAVVEPIPQDVLALVGGGSPYWTERGVGLVTADLWKLGEGKGRAFIPLIDRQGQVVAVKGRLLPGEEYDEMPGTGKARSAKYRLFPASFPSGDYLVGEHLLTKPVDFLVVVESEADAILLNEWFLDPAFRDAFPFGQATDGALAVSTAGGEFTARQVQKMVEALTAQGEVAVGMDADHAGRLATRKLVDALRKRVPRVSEIEWERKDPSDDDDGNGGKLSRDVVKADARRSIETRMDWFQKRITAALRT